MKNGQICFSLRKFLAISSAIQKIASDCGCDAVVHLVRASIARTPFRTIPSCSPKNVATTRSKSSGSSEFAMRSTFSVAGARVCQSLGLQFLFLCVANTTQTSDSLRKDMQLG